MIDPQEIIAKYSVEELNQTAEAYFSQIADPTHLFVKPFSSAGEASVLLENIGLLLSGVRLGHGMTVLEFAAGSCWLSRYITQLGCKTISVDVSQSALDYGKQLFEQYPTPVEPVAEPEFLLFDGFKLDLPDESVDRILCNDGFHHVPNQKQVLAELCRVLKPGGIAGFSEPGRYHSQGPVSQHDMAHFKVLENDILLNDVFEKAQAVGFTDIRIKPIGNLEVGLTLYNRMTSWLVTKMLSFVSPNTAEQLLGRSLFFLYKGDFQLDSRGSAGLKHATRLENPNQTKFDIKAGESVQIPLNITNSGEAVWLNQNIKQIGVVKVGTRLKDAKEGVLLNQWTWHELEREVRPGEQISMTVDVPFAEAGEFELILDLVAMDVAWFEHLGSETLNISVSVSA